MSPGFRRFQRGFTDLTYFCDKVYRRLRNFRPSPTVIGVILVGVSIFLLGGGVYDILIQPISIFPMRGRLLVWYPQRIHEQFLTESIDVMILYALGVGGLIFIYYSTRYFRNPRQATILIFIGITLTILAFIALEALLYWKIYGSV
ncbi:hypothetical protein DRO55_02870 [Candidatus Bathyarchaeota archaeon]|nr:MAG: hypothetical protein DRO55_02870 [Candidatus Bathyarchaeota archaeon]